MNAKSLVLKAEELRTAKKLDQASIICHQILKKYPDYFFALTTLGSIEFDRKNYRLALTCLYHAHCLEPSSVDLCLMLSGCHGELEHFELAFYYVDKAIELNSLHTLSFVHKSDLFRKIKDYESSLKFAKLAHDMEPENENVRINYAITMRKLGQEKDASIIISEMSPASKKYFEFANLTHAEILNHTDVVHDTDVSIVKHASPHLIKIKNHLRAFHKEHAQGDFESAWRHLEEANSLQYSQVKIYETDRKKIQDKLTSRLSILDKGLIPAVFPGLPISLFILGPSNSGKTTLERVLGGALQVKRGFENPIVAITAKKTMHHYRFPPDGGIRNLSREMHVKFKELYVNALADRLSDEMIFTNTLPTNINDVATIPRFVPNSRFVFVQRNEADILFKIFSKFYVSGNSYAYRLSDIREYIDFYNFAVEKICYSFPSIAIQIKYEDLCYNPLSAITKVQNLCGVTLNIQNQSRIENDIGVSKPYLRYLLAHHVGV